MLTIYEQIQRAVDFAEGNLFVGASSAEAAEVACMSVSSFLRYFPALTGYSFGEYVRKRRLSEAVDMLATTDNAVLGVALHVGYESHEAFTRAFKRELGVAPRNVRTGALSVKRTPRLNLIGEMMMGVLIKNLPEMRVACFDGFRPEPESSAHQQMNAWLAEHPRVAGSHRCFGHNIDAAGNLAHEPENEGYRVMVTLPDDAPLPGSDTTVATIGAGVFVVTGVEGSFEEDPSGSWITEGWRRLDVMVKRQGLRLHPSHRWFEELLDPVVPGRTRFDLYAELEPDAD